MKNRKKWMLALLCVLMLGLVACGKGEPDAGTVEGSTEEESYMAEEVGSGGINTSLWQEFGGTLYFTERDRSGDTLCGMELTGDLSMEGRKTYFKTEENQRIQDYTVDSQGNIYWISRTMDVYKVYRYDPAKGENAEFPLALESNELRSIAADGTGRLYFLRKDSLLIADGEGHVLSELKEDDFRWEARSGESVSEKLLGDPEGALYYVQDTKRGLRMKTLGEDGKEWKELINLASGCDASGVYLTGGQLLMRGRLSLFKYNPDNQSCRSLLKLAESGLDATMIMQLALLENEQMLAVGYDGSLYRMGKVSADALRGKETVVLASLIPDAELKAAVAEFNRKSDKYVVQIESYGATAIGDPSISAAITRLDSSLVSGSGPDLMDLADFGVDKYVEKGVIEDLTPYLENSSLVSAEDYIDGLIDKYTTSSGKLLYIPTHFQCTVVAGRTSQVGTQAGWTFEDLKALTEQYPDTKLFSMRYSLYWVYSDYYNEVFVDWDTGECRFDSEEFRDFIRFLEAHEPSEELEYAYYTDGRVPDDLLLMQYGFTSFYAIQDVERLFGEPVTFVGFVSQDGAPRYEIYPSDRIAILEDSKVKEGAWEFLEYYLTRENAFGIGSGFFPTRKDKLLELAEYDMKHTQVRIYTYNGESIKYTFHEVTQEEVDKIMAVFEAYFHEPESSGGGTAAILIEDLQPYFDGDRTLEDVTKITNNRIQLMVQEGL